MDNNIKVSLIIPVYNKDKYLSACLDCVLNQTLKSIEIICINDGSTDHSLEILNTYAGCHKNIIVVSQENQGPGKARNVAIALAHGEYIGFIDADDWVSLDYFEKLYECAIASDADIAATSTMYNSIDGVNIKKDMVISTKKLFHGDDKGYLIVASGSLCNKIYRKNFLLEHNIQNFESRHAGGDNYFNILSIIYANHIAVTNIPAYYYRYVNNSIVNNKRNRDSFGLVELYQSILNHINCDSETKLKFSIWSEAIYTRMRRDFIELYDRLNYEFKEEFLDFIDTKFPKMKFFEKNLSNLIISLTSDPTKIQNAAKSISTMLRQKYRVAKVILWLATEHFPRQDADIPTDLLKLKGNHFEIVWCEDITPYRKLIPALKQYPNYIIVTTDTATCYPDSWLKQLYDSYLDDPSCIHCYSANRLNYTDYFIDWQVAGNNASFLSLPIWSMGVLYPPNTLHEDVFDESKFKYVDFDVWFWAMALAKNTKFRIVPKNIPSSEDIVRSRAVLDVMSYYPNIKSKISRLRFITKFSTATHTVYILFNTIKISLRHRRGV